MLVLANIIYVLNPYADTDVLTVNEGEKFTLNSNYGYVYYEFVNENSLDEAYEGSSKSNLSFFSENLRADSLPASPRRKYRYNTE